MAQTYVGEDGRAAVLDPEAGALVSARAPIPAPAAAHEALGPQAVLARGEVAAAGAGDVQAPHLGTESGGKRVHGAQCPPCASRAPHSP